MPRSVVHREVAQIVAALNRFARQVDPSPSIPVAAVVEAELKRLGMRTATAPQERKRADRNRDVLETFASYWPEGTTIEHARAGMDAYVAHRCQQPVTIEVAAVSRTTAIADLEILKAEVRRFAKAHGLVGLPRMKLDRRLPRAHALIDRSELARLLWATLGWYWDPQTKRCRRVANTKRYRLLRTRRRAMGRMILLSAYTASEPEAIARLHWQPATEGKARSYVELEGNALLHRLGPDQAQGRIGGVPIALNRRITAHLRRWQRLDRPHADGTVMRHPDGSAYSGGSAAGFEELVSDAGLPDTIRKGDIKWSSGVHLAQREDVGSRSAAMMMGVTISRFVSLFAQFDPTFQDRVMRALDRRPASIARAAA